MDPWGADRVMGESLFTLLKFAVLPIAKVLVMCALGLLLASSTVNILPTPSRRQLSKVSFPLTLFFQISADSCFGLFSVVVVHEGPLVLTSV